ncbi:LysR family transcriptional regulator [Roseibium denhamense]|uniref:LysR family transcriptional regulator, transcriptional activator AphB n=1 Tax=Roseibium denhamense TaxID=76305 RepID=A0ABY1N5W4_9HYPH|nr:LysR family transcriptional regulator [Roseibium denhamense]MTI06109.1 LysR family transcriptional regulator [Roseibium denhamense]SMP01124.1 LysR family transcriptional regulator, transcriptional activator AphB [Roseibium denhamense]
MIDDIALFVHIVRARGLAGAAERLGLPPATVTRRLKKLEDRLDLQLLHRSSRKFALTAAGETYFEALADQVLTIEATLEKLSSDQHSLKGPLKAAAPTNISVGLLKPMWSSFLKAHPGILLDLRLSNRNIDLREGQIDLALRIGEQRDASLYQKRIGTIATGLVASPDYVGANSPIRHPEDLKTHQLIGVAAIPDWQLTHRTSGQEVRLPVRGDHVVDDISIARQFAEDGLGIALLGATEIGPSLETGSLVNILPEWQGGERPVYAVWPSGRLLSARAAALRDFMQAYLAARPIFRGTLS